MSATPMLACHKLTVSVPGRTLVRELDLELTAGECIGVLGRNGTGKTLMLHSLAGLREIETGSVELNGETIGNIPRRQLARQLGMLLQSTEDPFPSTALDATLTGRHPHIGFWQWESEMDIDIARQSLAGVGLEGMEQRVISTLSGGERRRVGIACILAQAPGVYLLDEPTNHLDPQHQVALLELFRRRVSEGSCALITLHDTNLAARFCDRVLLLFGDGDWLIGRREEVMTGETLSRLYQTRIEAVPWREGTVFVNL